MNFSVIRGGIKSTLRARKRSVLFMFLIMLLAFLLTAGMGFYLTSDQLVKQSNDTFVSSIRLEYLGEDYPNRTVYDSYVRKAFDEIDTDHWKDVKGIRSWNPTNSYMCYTDGYQRFFGEKPYVKSGVFVLSNLMPRYSASRYDEGYDRISCMAIVDKDLTMSTGVENVIVKVEIPSGYPGMQVSSGKKYLVHADLVVNNSISAAMETLRIKDFVIETDEVPVHLLSGNDDPYLTEGPFAEQARMYYGGNNYIEVRSAASIEALDEFQQAEVVLEQGRIPRQGEAGVCVISGALARRLEVQLGDSISLNVMRTSEEDYYKTYLTDQVKTLEIVGITEFNTSYEGNIWVSDAESNPDAKVFGYELGIIHIDNDEGPSAVEKLESLVPDQISVTLWDQGYKGAIEPIKTMRTVASAVVIAVFAGLVSTIILFAFLMITRQKETYDVLKDLGIGFAGVLGWFLSGTLMIAVPAAAAGAAGGVYLLKGVLALVFERIMGIEQTYYKFSETLMGLKRELPVPQFYDFQAGAISAAAVVVLVLIACTVAAIGMQRETEVKQGLGKLRPAKKEASMFGFGALRYAILSIRRNSFRSIVTPAVTCVLACIIGFFSFIQNNTDAQIQELYNHTAVEGRIVSMDGSTVSGLTVPPSAVRDLLKTGVADHISVSIMPGWHYWVQGELPDFGSGAFAGELLEQWIQSQPELVAVNRMKAAKEFYFSDPTVEWLDGYDASMLECETIEDLEDPDLVRSGSNRTWPVVAGKEFMAERSYSMGDIIPIEYEIFTRRVAGKNYYTHYSVKGKIVGSFAQSSDRSYIYLPVCFALSPSWIFSAEEPEGAPVSWTYNTCRFDIDPAAEVDNFREALWAMNYSEPQHMRQNRTTVLLKDRSFTETLSSLKRFSLITNLLLPILMGVICLIGFLVSWLLIHGRKTEFAMMRGFGVRYGRTNMSFLLEQIILCVIGVAAAVLILWLAKAGSLRTWLYLAGFTLMYLDGAAIAVNLVAKGSLMRLLQGNE